MSLNRHLHTWSILYGLFDDSTCIIQIIFHFFSLADAVLECLFVQIWWGRKRRQSYLIAFGKVRRRGSGRFVRSPRSYFLPTHTYIHACSSDMTQYCGQRGLGELLLCPEISDSFNLDEIASQEMRPSSLFSQHATSQPLLLYNASHAHIRLSHCCYLS